MSTIGRDRERLELTIPIGYKDKIDYLIEEGRRKFPDRKRFFQDRGTFLAWLIDQVWRIKEISDSIEEEAKSLEEQKARLDQKEIFLAEAESRLCRELGLLPYAKELWMELIQSEVVSKEEILSTLKAIKDAGLNFAEVARVIREENLPNLLAWARRIKEECIKAADVLTKTKEEVEAHKKAVAQLKEIEEELKKLVSTRLEELDRANLAVAQACAMARDVGLYVDYIKQAAQARGGERIQDLLPEPAMVIAGTILEAVSAAYGDVEITLVPGPGHPLPMRVTLREIARSLAPPEAYREQQKAQLRVEAMAEAIAAGYQRAESAYKGA